MTTIRPTARATRLMHRLHARLAALSRPAGGFVSQPEPKSIGLFARGKQLLAGNLLFAGHLVEARGRTPWEIDPPDAAYAEALHRFGWLDDLAAVGDGRARELALGWVMDWIARYGSGDGPGWTPELTGRRLMRLVNHALFLMRAQDRAASDRFYESLARQTIFLSRRWGAAAPGLPRFEALAGTVYAGLSLIGMEARALPAIRALAQDCAREIDPSGGIATRNPEELLEILTLLIWAAEAIAATDRRLPADLLSAIARIPPTLRALRHADGGLARFHGGGTGLEGRLDHALVASGSRDRPGPGLHMGYARLAAGRTTVIADAAKPPMGRHSRDAHASTLAFELTSGRRPVIVNCGAGGSFGPAWRQAGRATPSHATITVADTSSSRLGKVRGRGEELLMNGPLRVEAEFTPLSDGERLEMSHDGYRRRFGLYHGRTLEISRDGRGLVGEDHLACLSDGDRARFDRALDAFALQGVPFDIRFPLHPDVEAGLDLGGAAVSLALKSGEVWIFRVEGGAAMTLDPSVYLEKGRLRPRRTTQVVLSGRVLDYATRIRWSVAKAQDTPNALRDEALDETEAVLSEG